MAQAIIPPFTSSISAWWDFTDRASLGLTGSSIDQCDDQSGNGKHLTMTGGNRFLSQNRGGRNVAYANAIERGMVNTSMSINQRSFTLILAFQPIASKQLGNPSGAIVPWHIPSFFLYGSQSGKWTGIHDGSTHVNVPDSYMSDSPTLIVWSCGASSSKIRIDDGAILSGAPMAAGTATSMTFGNFSSLNLGVIGDFLGGVLLNRQFADAEFETSRRWSANHWGCGITKTHEVVCDGDSNMIGGLSSGYNDVEGSIYNPASQLARMRPNWRVFNYAVGGVSTATNTANLATQGALIVANPDVSLPTIGVHSNGNDYSDSTSAQAITRMQTYAETLGANRQIHCTIPNRVTSGFNAWAAATSALQKATFARVADLRSIPELADYTDTDYFSLDQIHRDENGFAQEAAVIASVAETAPPDQFCRIAFRASVGAIGSKLRLHVTSSLIGRSGERAFSQTAFYGETEADGSLDDLDLPWSALPGVGQYRFRLLDDVGRTVHDRLATVPSVASADYAALT
ncbi:MAG: SGNH/GDSL hydrolase family protein [Pirellula sp.]